MLELPPIAGINHVLTQHEWARQRLAPFAGQVVELRLPPLPELRFAIRDDGLLKSADRHVAPALSVLIKPAAVPMLLAHDERALHDLEFSGSAELAQVLQQLFRNLQWDVEADLSRVFGDVLAHRMANAGRELFAWQREASLRIGQNLAEYWTEEQPLIARHSDLTAFNAGVDALRDDVERLEKRLDLLAARRAAP